MVFRRLCVAVALVALVGACGHKGSSSASTSGARSVNDTTTTSAGAGSGSATTVTGGTARPGGASSTTTRAGGTGSGDPTSLPDARPTPAGGYIYDQSTSLDKGAPPTQMQLIVDFPTGSAGDLRQTQRTHTSVGDNVRHLAWRGDGMLVLDEFAESGQGVSPTCDWQPDYRELAFPLRVGLTWSTDSTCVSGSGSRERKGSAKVTGFRRVTVGADQVDVAVIERTETATTSTASATQTRHAVDWFAPGYGLLVRSAGTSTSHVPGQNDTNTSFTSQLRSVHSA